MTCFGVGFLFTFIPRRTGGEPARAWPIAVAVTAPIATTAFAWFELWVPSQACWVAFVHCLAGHNRTGIAVACYEMAVEGMTADLAIAEGETFGLHLPNQEEVRQAVRALAREVVPVADPAAFARERFGIPVLEGTYLLDGRTKELKPADKTTEANEEPPPDLLEQTRGYLRYCEARRMPGDCFGALNGRRTLNAHGRYTVAMGIAIAGTFEATHQNLKDMLSVREVLPMVVAGVTMYAVLWMLPEPTSKGLAAALTIVMVGYVGVHTLYAVGTGFADLIENSENATTFEALHDQGERFAQVMGADTAQVLVMVATAAVGSGLGQFLKMVPKLPGAPQASELALAEGGVPFEQLGAVEGVTIGKGGLTISLAGGAVLATSLGGGPRINLIRPTAAPQGPAKIQFPSAEQLAKRLGMSREQFHRVVKKAILKDFDAVLRKAGIDNPDIGVTEAGNIVLGDPRSNTQIVTDVPLDSYGGQ